MDKIRTAAYCRVSTEKEEQDGSYELQKRHFEALIRSNPDMELVGIYGDQGRSGLSVNGRPGMQQLLNDCRLGCIDLILTKSISRFARNMADCAGMLRELRGLGVFVYFESENLSSRDETCTLIVNIYSAIAQEESRSISAHSYISHEQYAMEGRPYGRISYGYQNGGDNRWTIHPQQAERVKTAFQMAGTGRCYPEILTALNAMEAEPLWYHKRLKRMLQNPVYKGDYEFRRLVCLVSGRQTPNRGYRDRYYIIGHHAPIIPPELFDRVQEILRRGMLISCRRRTAEDWAFLKGDA